MGENWMGIWIGTFIGAFIIVVAIYDYFDKKKRGQEIKIWNYLLAIIVGLALVFPIVTGFVLWLLGWPL